MRVLCAEVGCVYGGDAEPLLGVRNMAATCLVETEQGLAVPTGLTGRVKSRQQSPEPSGEGGGTRTHTFSLNGMFQSQLESQESLKVSFVSLNKDICDANVSVCKDEAAFMAEAKHVPRATRSTAHIGTTAAHRKARGCSTHYTHTYWSHPLYLTAS